MFSVHDAIIYSVYKGMWKRGERGNYSELSLLSVLDKIFSGVLDGRQRDWLLNKKILSRFQVGFIKGKITTENIFAINTTIDRY